MANSDVWTFIQQDGTQLSDQCVNENFSSGDESSCDMDTQELNKKSHKKNLKNQGRMGVQDISNKPATMKKKSSKISPTKSDPSWSDSSFRDDDSLIDDGEEPALRSKKKPFKFISPPEAPVFYPSKKEFEDPLKYISKISRVGIDYGIVKIVPPEGWKPPFALNYDEFKFKPRIQKINELEAHTRMKLNFMAKLAREVAKEGKFPKHPYIEKSLLDLYTLDKIVKNYGGYDIVCGERRWNAVASEMGFTNKTAAINLRSHYETWILPYLDVINRKGDENEQDPGETDEEMVKLTNIRELKSLEFLGPGPKMSVCNYNFSANMKTRTRHKKVSYEFDPLAKYMCQACGHDDSDGALATCKFCDDKYHMVCLVPPLQEQPKEWICVKCVVASDPNNPFEEFGFETADKEYTLKQFGIMADKFKQNHFKTPGRLVPTEKMEEEYWRIMGELDSDVTVLYGADLSTGDVGSGFPKYDTKLDGYDEEAIKSYAESRWNLNHLADLESSALRHITTNISGMKVPWAYVGMSFSTFCWHNEDHWSYSINYLHWGEPKTWYGVAGKDADRFETKMKRLAPELFDVQPDLLHQLVTTMNPNLLMSDEDKKMRIPIFRTDQKEGEFVITFPRAYHAGFNQGFNFAEACNFAPADWIKMGRESVEYYSKYSRNCVFSHDELICTMAENPEVVEKQLGIAAYHDMKTMITTEIEKRKLARERGIIRQDKHDFSCAKDDNRQCSHCKTTCFLSAIYCDCSPNKLVCLDHSTKLCECSSSKKILKYQYTIAEMVSLHMGFTERIDDFEAWLDLIKIMYKNKEAKPRVLSKLLVETGRSSSIPKSIYFKKFQADVFCTLKCAGISRIVIQNILRKEERDQKLSFRDLNDLYEIFKGLPWKIPELKSIESLINSVTNFQTHLKELLQSKNPPRHQLESCLEVGNLLHVTFDELNLLEKKLVELEERDNTKRLGSAVSREMRRKKNADEMREIAQLISGVKNWNAKACSILGSREKCTLNQLEDLFNEGKSLKIDGPVIDKLNLVILEATKWQEYCQDVVVDKDFIHLSQVEELLANGKLLPIKLSMITDLELEYNKTKRWLDRVKDYFVYKQSTESLLQNLWPRKFMSRDQYFNSRKSETPSEIPDPMTIESLEAAAEEEFQSLLTLRRENLKKKTKQYKNEKNLCVCKEEIDGTQICCELCQTEYHLKCFSGNDIFNRNFATLPYKNLYCCYCIRSKRPSFSALEKLMILGEELALKVPEYFVLEFLFSNYRKVYHEVQSFLATRDITIAMQKINSHVPKSYLDVPLVQISDSRLIELKTLVFKVDLMETTLPEHINIWTLLEATKLDTLNRKRSLPDLIPRPIAKRLKASPVKQSKTVRPRRGSDAKAEVAAKPETEKDPVPTETSTPKNPQNLLTIRFDPVQRREYLNEERCASEMCLKPVEENVNWVQCDVCKLWFHMRCVNIEAKDITIDDEYVCLSCFCFGGEDGASDSSSQTDN